VFGVGKVVDMIVAFGVFVVLDQMEVVGFAGVVVVVVVRVVVFGVLRLFGVFDVSKQEQRLRR
jgi:hypothetical protein